jgi:hypothetical protein
VSEIKTEKVTINIPSVDTWNITALRYTCKRNKVKGYTKMNRDQLIIAVKEVMKGMGEERGAGDE